MTLQVRSADNGHIGAVECDDADIAALIEEKILGARIGVTWIGAIDVWDGGKLVERKDAFYDAPCPACGQFVKLTEEDTVWTCPADLSDQNPFKESAPEYITEELQEQHGVFSNCGEDFGHPCYERMPLHGDCYENGEY
ncbi:hypothetical protein AB0A69_08120 [Streptomyces sp. NPDC045431]|uniref:hypothetical protein n=1 Tax=Streptomyces sp. NPDC045431 TaxID=3155613 RepID=UPI003411594C